MPLFASGVQVPDALSQSFQKIGTQGTGNINDIYNKIKNRYSADARGVNPGGQDLGPNSYGGQRFATRQAIDTGNLESAVGGQVGDTAYKDTLAQRDYEQQRQLADTVAAAGAPSLLEQVLAGVGGGANAGLQSAMLYKQFSNPSLNTNGPSTGNLSLWQDGNYGLPMYKSPISGGY